MYLSEKKFKSTFFEDCILKKDKTHKILFSEVKKKLNIISGKFDSGYKNYLLHRWPVREMQETWV